MNAPERGEPARVPPPGRLRADPDAARAAPDELAGGSGRSSSSRSLPPWMWRAVTAVALVVAAAIVGPGLLASSEPAPLPGPDDLPTLPASRFESRSPRPVAPLDWDVRGDLAGDRAFQRDALARVRKSDPAAAKVLFAASLPDGGRIALVALARSDPVSDLGRGVHMRAVHVPPGGEPATLKADPVPLPRLMDEDDLTGWAGKGTGGRVYAVVLGRPGPLLVEASPLIFYHQGGGASRRWQPLSAPDGSALVDLGARSDQVVVVRSQSPESRVYPLVLAVDHDPRGDVRTALPAPDPSRVAGLRAATYRGPPAGPLTRALAEGHEYRFDPATADLRILWSGAVEPGRRAALVRARRSDGPTFQLLITEEGGRVSSHGPRHVPWADADVTPWLFVQGDPDEPVLLLNPSRRATAQLTEGGAPSRRIAIGPDGIGVLQGTKQGEAFTGLSGARIAIVSPDGTIVVSSSLRSLGVDDVFVLS